MKIELGLLAAVAVVSTYHVVVRFSDADIILIAVLQGVALSALLAYFAHSLATKKRWQKVPAFIGLTLFAVFSGTFQTLHFLNHDASLLEAIARGCWAPTAEVLLGLLLVQSVRTPVKASGRPSKLTAIFDAAADNVTAKLTPVQSPTVQASMIDTASAPVVAMQTDAMSKPSEKMTPDQRRAEILSIMDSTDVFSPTSVARQLNTSRGSIYNDLRALESQELVHVNGNGWERT